MSNTALKRLEDWVEKERGRQVDIQKPNGYQPHDWEIKLVNIDLSPKDSWVDVEQRDGYSFATVIGIDNSELCNSYYNNAENFVLGIDSDLEAIIHLVIDRAEKLGL